MAEVTMGTDGVSLPRCGEINAGALFIHGTASSGRIWKRLLGCDLTRAGIFRDCGVSRVPGVSSVSGVSGESRVSEVARVTGVSRVSEVCGSSVTVSSVLRGPVLTPDLPGMGDARVPGGCRPTFGGWLEHLREAVAASNPQRLPIHLVGHSLGGAIAIHLAQEPWAESVTLLAPATRVYCENHRRTSRPGAGPGSVVLPEIGGRLVRDPRRLSREEARILREDYTKAKPLLSEGVPWPPFPMDEVDYLCGKRVLLIYGEDDGIVPSRYFARLGKELESRASVVVEALPDCGHIPQIERAAEVAGSLLRFWAMGLR
jgi:pimeloyl-ACP methyl ester carboxylesterase